MNTRSLINPTTRTVSSTLNIIAALLLMVGSAAAADLTRASLAGIQLGEGVEELIERLGEPELRSRKLYDERDRCSVQILFYEARGVEVAICTRRGEGRVRSLRTIEGSSAKNERRIGVGDNLRALQRRYSQLRQIDEGLYSLEDELRNRTMLFRTERQRIIEVVLLRHPEQDRRSRLARRVGYRR